MKTILVKFTGLVLLAFLLFSSTTAQDKSAVAFKISEPDLIPEGIAYDSQTRTFYVGSTYLRKIVSIDRQGAAKNFTLEGQDGLRGVVGMRVDEKRRLLWAISSHAGLGMPIKGNDRDCIGCSEVLKYDLRTGRLIKKYVLKNEPQHFLNDLTLGKNGDVYVTDTVRGIVYSIPAKGDQLTEFLNLGEQTYPNGIDLSADEKHLFVAVSGKIGAVDLRGKKVNYLSMPEGTKPGVIDGLYFYKNSLNAVQPFDAGRAIVRYHLNNMRDAVVRAEVVEASHKLMSQPTTGTVVGGDFYYLANSQLQVFRRLFQPANGSFDKTKLSDVFVLKVRL